MTHGMTAVRQDPLARLDAWVLEELEAVSGPRRPVDRARPRRRPTREPTPAAEAGPVEAPFALEETHFVQQVTDWLSGRPNADLILEEIWRNVLAAGAEGDDAPDRPMVAEDMVAEDLAASDDPAAPGGASWDGPVDDFAADDLAAPDPANDDPTAADPPGA